MASMSPPPVKRGVGRPKKRDSSAIAASGGGRSRKKRQQSQASESVVNTPSASVGGPTPGPSGSQLSPEHHPTPGALPRSVREGSTFSSSRRSNATTNRGAGTNKDGKTDAGDTDDGDDDDEDDEGDNELDLLLGDAEYDEQAKERSEAKEALRLLLDQFTPEQLERYEVYRRSGFQKGAIRKLINHVVQQSCTPNIIVAVRGLAKVFVGEIVESAREVQAEGKHEGPLAPDDLREAYRRYKAVKEKRGHERKKLFVR